MEWLAERMQREHELRVVMTHDEEPFHFTDDARALLFRAVSELLANVVKHSRSPTARVSVGRASSKIRILVEDGGVGMSPREFESVKGFGLFSIRESLRELDGSLTIDSKPGATRVLIEVPLLGVGNTGSRTRARS